MTATAIDVEQDLDAHTLTVTTAYAYPVAQVWQLIADPRKLERWWGPPTYPATVTAHDLTVGGDVVYEMTGPEGDTHKGMWHVLEVDPPHELLVRDSFCDPEGKVLDEMPASTMRFRLTDDGAGGTQFEAVSTFETREGLEQTIAMGVIDGLRGAMSQIDAILAEG